MVQMVPVLMVAFKPEMVARAAAAAAVGRLALAEIMIPGRRAEIISQVLVEGMAVLAGAVALMTRLLDQPEVAVAAAVVPTPPALVAMAQQVARELT